MKRSNNSQRSTRGKMAFALLLLLSMITLAIRPETTATTQSDLALLSSLAAAASIATTKTKKEAESKKKSNAIACPEAAGTFRPKETIKLDKSAIKAFNISRLDELKKLLFQHMKNI